MALSKLATTALDSSGSQAFLVAAMTSTSWVERKKREEIVILDISFTALSCLRCVPECLRRDWEKVEGVKLVLSISQTGDTANK